MIALVAVTFLDAETATRIARVVVEERLAACANLGGDVTSVYRWRDAVEETRETPALFKTTPELAPALAGRLAALHPYELPSIEWWAAETTPAALQWVRGNVAVR